MERPVSTSLRQRRLSVDPVAPRVPVPPQSIAQPSPLQQRGSGNLGLRFKQRQRLFCLSLSGEKLRPLKVHVGSSRGCELLRPVEKLLCFGKSADPLLQFRQIGHWFQRGRVGCSRAFQHRPRFLHSPLSQQRQSEASQQLRMRPHKRDRLPKMICCLEWRSAIVQQRSKDRVRIGVADIRSERCARHRFRFVHAPEPQQQPREIAVMPAARRREGDRLSKRRFCSHIVALLGFTKSPDLKRIQRGRGELENIRRDARGGLDSPLRQSLARRGNLAF